MLIHETEFEAQIEISSNKELNDKETKYQIMRNIKTNAKDANTVEHQTKAIQDYWIRASSTDYQQKQRQTSIKKPRSSLNNQYVRQILEPNLRLDFPTRASFMDFKFLLISPSSRPWSSSKPWSVESSTHDSKFCSEECELISSVITNFFYRPTDLADIYRYQ